jgi:sugar lactone lactonase YvrE
MRLEMDEVACVLDARSTLGEGALWDARSAVLYWVDIKKREIHRFDPASGEDAVWATPEDIGSLAVRSAGGLVVAMTSGFHLFDFATGGFEALADPEPDRPENRFNDGKPDRRGRFWAGTMHDPETTASGALYRLDPDHRWHRMVEGVTVSNGLAWSPAGDVMYYACSSARTVWAYESDPETGALGERRVFTDTSPLGGAPDGATVDAEGCYWLTLPGAWKLARYDPAGRLMRTILLPVELPTCVAFGGPDLDILYVTTSRFNRSEAQLADQPLAGGLFALDVGVRGMAEARFPG